MRKISAALAVLLVVLVGAARAVACVDPVNGTPNYDCTSTGNTCYANESRFTPSNALIVSGQVNQHIVQWTSQCSGSWVESGVESTGYNYTLTFTIQQFCGTNGSIVGQYTNNNTGQVFLKYLAPYTSEAPHTLAVVRRSGLQTYDWKLDGAVVGTVSGATGANASQIIFSSAHYPTSGTYCTRYTTVFASPTWLYGYFASPGLKSYASGPYLFTGDNHDV